MSEALTRQVVTFGRVLREAGLEVGAGRLADALRGLDRVDLGRQDDVYWTLRTTLVARREELEPFDRAFRAWFLRAPAVAPPRREDPRRMPRSAQRVRRDARPGADAATAEGEPDSIGASPHEVLRRKDFGAMTGEELAQARRLITELDLERPRRRSRRLRPHRRGRALDLRRLARSSLATGGDPVQRRFRRRVPDAAQARRALRRLGLDGGLQPRDAPLPPRARALGARGGGLRVRHPPDAADRRARHARSRGGAARAPPTASSTGRRARASARR